MALRDFVTGGDTCTPDEGAGPSNAAATLVNSLLGRSAKDRERLREVSAFHVQRIIVLQLSRLVVCLEPKAHMHCMHRSVMRA